MSREVNTLDLESFKKTTTSPPQAGGLVAETGFFVQRALDHVRDQTGVLGLLASQPAEFVANPNVQQTSSGAVAVHLQQLYKSVPIFQASQTVRFAPDSTLTGAVGNSLPINDDVSVVIKVSVTEGVLAAAQHVAVPDADEHGGVDPFGEPVMLTPVDLTGFIPRVLVTFSNIAEQPTVLAAGPFADLITASLVWFSTSQELRLAWQVILTMPNFQGQFRTIVDTDSGTVLYCVQLVQLIAARGNVYRVDGDAPREMTTFPRPVADFSVPVPSDLPAGFPQDWVDVDATSGNNVNAHLNDNGPPLPGTIQDGALTFDPVDPVGDEQKVLNIFYYNCYMHDLMYLLGFRETDGNFQQDNFGLGGLPGDRVDGRAHAGPVFQTANMSYPVDGLSPIMNMGLVTSTNRHTAFDSSVVFHEFTHGVTNRLVGGAMNDSALEMPQSTAMGEGWGDYFACTINGINVIGAWVVNKPGGIRGFPYDSSFPNNFGDLGTGRYKEKHNNGEIWCATLMEMNRNIGSTLGLQLVMDALKLSPANPSFLDMRDAIRTALDNKLAAGQLTSEQHAVSQKGVWAAFAKFGMGPSAQTNGATLTGIIADFNQP